MKPKDEGKEVLDESRKRGLDEALGREGKKEIFIKVKGKRENTHIYRA